MKIKILVVDDNEGILEGFRVVLESVGYIVQTARDADFIENLTKENLPDLIFLDVLLSGVDGRDLCKQLKKGKFTKNIPVIMVSAAPNVEKSIKKAGADDFIKKPFEMDDLLATVKKYTQRPAQK